MARYRIKEKLDLTSITTQEYRTLHETLDEYLRTGVLDVPNSDSSFDFDSSDDVDFNKVVPHDVDIYDAACGHDDPFLGVVPLKSTPDNATENNTVSEPSVIES